MSNDQLAALAAIVIVGLVLFRQAIHAWIDHRKDRRWGR